MQWESAANGCACAPPAAKCALCKSPSTDTQETGCTQLPNPTLTREAAWSRDWRGAVDRVEEGGVSGVGSCRLANAVFLRCCSCCLLRWLLGHLARASNSPSTTALMLCILTQSRLSLPTHPAGTASLSAARRDRSKGSPTERSASSGRGGCGGWGLRMHPGAPPRLPRHLASAFLGITTHAYGRNHPNPGL